jgi:hypothetical protein
LGCWVSALLNKNWMKWDWVEMACWVSSLTNLIFACRLSVFIFCSFDFCCFRRFRKITKLHYYLRRVCASVHPYGTTRLPMDGFHEIRYLSIFRKSVEKIQV